MMLLRLLSFVLRVAMSFLFVFFLQLQFKGKTFESYLNDFSKTFIITKSLKKVSQDGALFIRDMSSKDKKTKSRQISNSKPVEYVKDFAKQITSPIEALKKEQEKNIEELSE